MLHVGRFHLPDKLRAQRAVVFVEEELIDSPVGYADGFCHNVAETSGCQLKGRILYYGRGPYDRERHGSRDHALYPFDCGCDVLGCVTVHGGSSGHGNVGDSCFSRDPFTEVIHHTAPYGNQQIAWFHQGLLDFFPGNLVTNGVPLWWIGDHVPVHLPCTAIQFRFNRLSCHLVSACVCNHVYGPARGIPLKQLRDPGNAVLGVDDLPDGDRMCSPAFTLKGCAQKFF